MEGVLRLDLDVPEPPKRTSTTNPAYQPKPIPAARAITNRPNFRVSAKTIEKGQGGGGKERAASLAVVHESFSRGGGGGGGEKPLDLCKQI